MVQAFSQLKRVLVERRLSVPQLQRRLEEQGLSVNLKSLYRLVNDDQPLERLNLAGSGDDLPGLRRTAFETDRVRVGGDSASTSLNGQTEPVGCLDGQE